MGAAGMAKDRPNADRYGNSRRYTLARLERDHPALYVRVVAGELSAHRAAISAGFRPKLTPIDRAMRAVVKLSDSQWEAILAWRPYALVQGPKALAKACPAFSSAR